MFTIFITHRKAAVKNLKFKMEDLITAGFLHKNIKWVWVVFLSANQWQPFNNEEVIKSCLTVATKGMCPEKINLFKVISLSAWTVTQKVGDKVKDKANNLEWFSLALDESTDVKDIA